MNALLLVLLAQVPMPPTQDPAKAAAMLPLPVGNTRPEELGPDQFPTPIDALLGHLGEDFRLVYTLSQDENWRLSLLLGRNGIGPAWEGYLGHGFAWQIDLRTILLRPTPRVSFIWYPLEDMRLAFTLDLLQGRVGLPDRAGLYRLSATVVEVGYNCCRWLNE
jgi:hypothetical protein